MISIIIPCFNEENTISKILTQVIAAQTLGLKKQIIVVNDGSNDGSLKIIQNFSSQVKIISYEKNKGKGFAIQQALEHCDGDYILVQDADLEYSPDDYEILLQRIISDNGSVVYGSRIRNNLDFKSRISPFYWGGIILTELTNSLYQAKLTDIHTCYKLFKADTISNTKFSSNRFEICHEMTAHFLNNKYNIVEVPISYTPRTFADGKKIRFQDGLRGCAVLIRCKLQHRFS
jgi:dolichol-phosphate mannosyltransferase